MATGRVKFFNENKGFGFITPDDDSGDVFVHHSSIRRDPAVLKEDEQVTYEIDSSTTKVKQTSSVS